MKLKALSDVRFWHLADIALMSRNFPLLGVKQTSGEGAAMSAFDPKRTWTLCDYKVIHGSRAKLVIGLIAAESASISRNAANE
jgi:hypothetical protein